MIIDKIANLGIYTSVVKNLDHALAFMNEHPSLPMGKHPFDGGFIIVSEGTSLHISEKDFEAHRKYADVMVILEHDETVSYAPISGLSVVKAYDSEADCGMYSGDSRDITVTVPAGFFYAVMPDEGHKPAVHIDSPKPFRKYIVKCSQC